HGCSIRSLFLRDTICSALRWGIVALQAALPVSPECGGWTSGLTCMCVFLGAKGSIPRGALVWRNTSGQFSWPIHLRYLTGAIRCRGFATCGQRYCVWGGGRLKPCLLED